MSAAIMITPTAKVISVMATIQSNPSSIELADRAQNKLFVVSVIFGVLAAMAGAMIAWRLWGASNRYQEAVKADADARIAEARNGAAQANVQAAKADERAGEANKEAGRANERAGELELQAQKLVKENLALRSGVADLEKAAADARSKQAEAELHLKQLAERQQRQESPRWMYLSPLRALLKGKPTGVAEVLYPKEDDEAASFAFRLAWLMDLAGWKIARRVPISASLTLLQYSGENDSDGALIKRVGGQRGISLVINTHEGSAYEPLINALRTCGFSVKEGNFPGFPDGLIRIVVGPKE
jgi:hypothetical protein